MSIIKTKIEEMGRLSESEFHAAAKRPVIAVLDNVRSQYNVGAVFRTADAFLINGVWLCGICPRPENVEVHKTALGAETTVDSRYFADTKEAVAELHRMGYTVYAVEQCHGSILLPHLSIAPDRPVAVVFGHEVFGVAQDVIDLCDGCIEIPQFGTKHSLNVSTTAGIILYELTQERENQG